MGAGAAVLTRGLRAALLGGCRAAGADFGQCLAKIHSAEGPTGDDLP